MEGGREDTNGRMPDMWQAPVTDAEIDEVVLAIISAHPGFDVLGVTKLLKGNAGGVDYTAIDASCERLLRAGRITSYGPFRAVESP